MKVGFHITNSSNLKRMTELVQKTRGNSFQFYSRNLRGGNLPEYSDKQLNDYYSFLFTKRVSSIVMALPLYYKKTGNTKISGNLAEKNPELIEEILLDLNNAKKIQAKYFVVHTGYYKERTEDEAIECLLENLNEILKRSEWQGTILVRNCVGEGSQVASDLFNYARIVNSGNSRIKAALDFSKLYAAGYNIINKMEFKVVKAILKNEIGFENIPLVYINDTDRFCGSRKDKSSVPLGKGVMGYGGYLNILSGGEFNKAVKIIEYHHEDAVYYDKIIKFLMEIEE